MDSTPNLRLPYLIAAQSQKHVTHNEAIRALDAVVQLSVIDRSHTAPPATLADGDRYIVAASPTGAWSGHAGQLAAWQDGGWLFYPPAIGWLAYVVAESIIASWSGTTWTPVSSGGGTASVNPTPLVGVNTTADATNRLAVSSAASLFNHAGAGHQHKINKATAADTASLLYQTGFSGRAEVGLAGDDNLHVKVSADGATWKEALIVDRASGQVSLPFTSFAGSTASLWAGKRWAALGTSITSGGTYSTPLAALLGATLTNLGASSASLSSSSANGPAAIYNARTSIPANADLVTVEAGINDFRGNATLGAFGDTTTATFYGALYRIAADVLAVNPQRTVVFFTPYGNVSGSTGTWDHANDNGVTLLAFQQAVRDVAHKFGCPVIDVGGESGIGGATGAIYLADGLHPSTDGGTRFAQFVYDRLQLVRPAVSSFAAAPTFSVAPGTYTASQTVALASATAGATIYVTTDGSTPTTASSVYSAPLSIAANTTVKVIAVKSGLTTSAVSTAAYVIAPPVPAATPTFAPAAGSYTSIQTVAITCATAGATIYVTTDGSTPTTASAVYSGPLTVSASTTVKAMATASGFTASAVANAAYTITLSQTATPSISPAAGTYTTSQTVTLACATSGATIYVTTDGSTPTTASAVYSTALTVSANTTVKAMATASGFTASGVATAAYVIAPPVAVPTFSPAAGTYGSTQTVTIACATAGATIYVTTDGSTPTTASSVYSAALTVAATTTVKAYAVKAGMTDSAVATAAYTIAAVTTWSTTDAAAGSMTLSNATKTVTDPNNTTWKTIRSSTSRSSGKVYAEMKAVTAPSGYWMHGLCNAAFNIGSYLGSSAASIGWQSLGATYYNGFSPNFTSVLSGIAVNDVIGTAIDFTAGYVWVSKNGTWLGGGDPAAGTNPTATFTPGSVGALYLAHTAYQVGSWTLAADAASQTNAAPSGFTAWG